MLDWINRLKIKMDSQQDFYQEIKKHYAPIDKNIDWKLKRELYYNLAYIIHNHYKDCRMQYKKSLKRYSKLKIEDLENDFYKWWIIDFVKTNYSTDYKEVCGQLFNMNQNEFSEYEKRREEFNNMF